MKEHDNFDDSYNKSADIYHVKNSKKSHEQSTNIYHDEIDDLEHLDFESKDSINCEFTFTVIFLIRRFIVCTFCKEKFLSNFRLHQHISMCVSNKKSSIKRTVLFSKLNLKVIFVIKFTVSTFEEIEYAFRDFQYVTIKVSFNSNETKDEICLDTECIMTLEDRNYLKLHLLDYQSLVKLIRSFISIRDIDDVIHEFTKYFIITLYIERTLNNKSVLVSITREIHLMNNLKMNMLINIDILVSKRMILNMSHKILFIESCEKIEIEINVKVRKNVNIRRIVRVKDRTVISLNALIQLSVLMRQLNQLSCNRDLIFESCYTHNLDQSDNLYAHVVDASLCFVQIRNATNRLITIQRHARLEKVVKFSEESCFLASSSDLSLAVID